MVPTHDCTNNGCCKARLDDLRRLLDEGRASRRAAATREVEASHLVTGTPRKAERDAKTHPPPTASQEVVDLRKREVRHSRESLTTRLSHFEDVVRKSGLSLGRPAKTGDEGRIGA